MGKKRYNPRFMFGGTEWCNTDMACKILCEKKFPEKTEPAQIQSVNMILRKAMEAGKINVERERGMIAWEAEGVRGFANAYDRTPMNRVQNADNGTYDVFLLALSDAFDKFGKVLTDDIIAKVEEIFIPKIVQEVKKIFV